MIVVVGGTGRLGRLVVEELTGRGEQVRVVARDTSRSADLAERPGVSVIAADVRDAASLVPAVEGADVVISAVQGFVGSGGVTPDSVDRDGNRHLTDAARAVGAEIVLVSVVGAASDAPMELFRCKSAAEQHLSESGVPATIVRATAFAELWIDILRRTARGGGRPVVFGRGINPINFVSVHDVASVVSKATLDRATRGMVLEVGGPDQLTFTQLATMVSGGRPPRHLRPAVLRTVAATVGRVVPAVGRQMRAALVMDEDDLTFDAAPARGQLPWSVPFTPVTDLVAVPQPQDRHVVSGGGTS